jgi:hypothetical protein
MPEHQPDSPNLTERPFEERRASERFACDRPSFWVEWGGPTDESSPARLQNISVTGLCLVTAAPIRPGTIVVVRLHSEARGMARQLVARVVHSTQQADGQWLSGAAFLRQLSVLELEVIIQEGQPG